MSKTFVLLGVPGLGKDDLADKLADMFSMERLILETPSPFAIGFHTDYRVELKLALERTPLQDYETPLNICSHSLLDNLGYTTFALMRHVDNDMPDREIERLLLSSTIIGSLVNDSFRGEHIFFIRKDFDEDAEYEQAQLQNIFKIILDELNLSYTEIDSSNALETIKLKLDELLNG